MYNKDLTYAEKASSHLEASNDEFTPGATCSVKPLPKLEPLRSNQSNEKSLRSVGRPSTLDKNGSAHEFSPKISFNRHEMYLRSYGLLPQHTDSSNAAAEGVGLSERRVDLSDSPNFQERTETDDTPSTSGNMTRMTVRDIASGQSNAFNHKERLAVGQDTKLAVIQDSHTKLPLISAHSSLTSALVNMNNMNGIASRSSTRNTKTLENSVTDYDRLGLTQRRYGEKQSMTINELGKHRALPLDTSEHMKVQSTEGCRATRPSEGVMPYLPTPPPVTLLPPVRPFVIKKKRCFLCGKKTGLASSYICRCGENFCATHRYAEAHACTFDYKANGRQVLKEANPVVSSRKLPKI